MQTSRHPHPAEKTVEPFHLWVTATLNCSDEEIKFEGVVAREMVALPDPSSEATLGMLPAHWRKLGGREIVPATTIFYNLQELTWMVNQEAPVNSVVMTLTMAQGGFVATCLCRVHAVHLEAGDLLTLSPYSVRIQI